MFLSANMGGSADVW